MVSICAAHANGRTDRQTNEWMDRRTPDVRLCDDWLVSKTKEGYNFHMHVIFTNLYHSHKIHKNKMHLTKSCFTVTKSHRPVLQLDYRSNILPSNLTSILFTIRVHDQNLQSKIMNVLYVPDARHNFDYVWWTWLKCCFHQMSSRDACIRWPWPSGKCIMDIWTEAYCKHLRVRQWPTQHW